MRAGRMKAAVACPLKPGSECNHEGGSDFLNHTNLNASMWRSRCRARSSKLNSLSNSGLASINIFQRSRHFKVSHPASRRRASLDANDALGADGAQAGKVRWI